MIDLACRRFHDLGNFRHDRTFGQRIDGLLNNAHRLPHLGHANQVSIVGVAVFSNRNVEVEILVIGVRLRLAQIPLHAAGAEYRAGHAERDAIFTGDYADIFGAFDPDAVGGKQLFVFVDFGTKEIEKVFYFLFEPGIGFVLQATDAERMMGQARAAIVFVDLQNFFAVAERVKQWRDCADIKGMRSQPKLMAGDAIQFREDDPDMLGPRRRLNVEKLLYGLAVPQAV